MVCQCFAYAVAEAVKMSLNDTDMSKGAPPINKEEVKEKSKANSQAKDPDWLPEQNFVTTIVKVESFECKHCAAVYNSEVKLVKHQSRRHWQKKRFHKYKCDD